MKVEIHYWLCVWFKPRLVIFTTGREDKSRENNAHPLASFLVCQLSSPRFETSSNFCGLIHIVLFLCKQTKSRFLFILCFRSIFLSREVKCWGWGLFDYGSATSYIPLSFGCLTNDITAYTYTCIRGFNLKTDSNPRATLSAGAFWLGNRFQPDQILIPASFLLLHMQIL